MARPRKNKRNAVPRSSARPNTSAQIPDVYEEMLRDALSTSPPPSGEERAIKRRRIGGRIVGQTVATELNDSSDQTVHADGFIANAASEDQPSGFQQQTAYNDTEDSAESDIDWEEVDLQELPSKENDDSVNHQDLDLVLDEDKGAQAPRALPRRRIATLAERQLKLDIHKLHVLCLFAHVYLRNHWCNDEEIHRCLQGLLSKRTVSYLNPDENKSQFQRSRSFNDGLNQAVDAFRVAFKITARGLTRPYWAGSAADIAAIDPPMDIDLPLQMTDFRDVARKREASRDVGAQLFCALLRSVGVDVRLTCSLQVLPINASVNTKPSPAKKPVSVAYYRHEQQTGTGEGKATGTSSREHTPEEPQQKFGSRGGRSRFASPLSTDSVRHFDKGSPGSKTRSPAAKAKIQKRIVESPYPIYWVEAFDEAAQKWIAVDPLVTNTIGKARRLEPPASDRENNMVYVISFEDDGSVRDVTKRYAKSFNAKTRRMRVEGISEGERWLRRVFNVYRRPHRMDRDQVEDTELARKEAQEGLPENVQDFKDHPYYALERHLRRNEVIHPKREVGKVSAGRGANNKAVEPIYRRCDVHIVKSADKWYRMGREIKAKEQPLKRVVPRRGRDTSLDQSQVDEESAGTPLYTYEQTTEYKPPPVVNGKLPKNIYGNLDVYVSSMVPEGAIHLKHPETQRAARFLGVDYADAVTGFSFKGRHGTAIVNGAVVALEHANAIQQLIIGFENERAQEENAKRSLEALKMWKRFLAGLRIRERIEGYDIEGEDNVTREIVTDDDDQSDNEGGGGFFPSREEDSVAKPTAGGWIDSNEQEIDEQTSGGFLAPSLVHSTQDDYARHKLVDKGAETHEFNESLPSDDDTFQKMPDTESKTVASPSSPKPVKHTTTQHLSTIASNPESHSILRETSTKNLHAKNDRTTSTMALSDLGIADDEDLMEATMLQQSYDLGPRGTLESEPEVGTQIQKSLSPPLNPPPDTRVLNSTEPLESSPHTRSTSRRSTLEGSQGHESSDDSGSLLLEDPSDEDADPEWIV